VAGAFGSCCARSRKATIRAATLVYITIAFSGRVPDRCG